MTKDYKFHVVYAMLINGDDKNFYLSVFLPTISRNILYILAVISTADPPVKDE